MPTALSLETIQAGVDYSSVREPVNAKRAALRGGSRVKQRVMVKKEYAKGVAWDPAS